VIVRPRNIVETFSHQSRPLSGIAALAESIGTNPGILSPCETESARSPERRSSPCDRDELPMRSGSRRIRHGLGDNPRRAPRVIAAHDRRPPSRPGVALPLALRSLALATTTASIFWNGEPTPSNGRSSPGISRAIEPTRVFRLVSFCPGALPAPAPPFASFPRCPSTTRPDPGA